jgi:hypothetical protein
VSAHNALLNRLKSKGNIKTVSGGYELVFPTDYDENDTYQRFNGLDLLNTNVNEILTSTRYPWQQIALHIVSSGRELRMNSGEEKMIDLVMAKKKNAMRTAQNQFSIDLYSTGALTNQIGGLGQIITTDGTGTVGGIVSGTYTWWKNKFLDNHLTSTTTPSLADSTILKGDMNAMWLLLARGSDKPDLIVSSHDFFAMYEVAEQDKQRYTDEGLAKAGFTGYKYKGADVIFDSNSNFGTTAEKMYFLDTSYLYLVQHREAKWTMDEEKKPINQDAVVVPMYWMGNLVCTRRAAQGVIFDA